MPNIDTGIYETLGRQLRVLYADTLAQGVPDHLAAILTTPEGDSFTLAANSPAVLPASALAV